MREVRLSETAARGILERNSETEVSSPAFRCSLSRGWRARADELVFKLWHEDDSDEDWYVDWGYSY
jgi:hypothetical protein